MTLTSQAVIDSALTSATMPAATNAAAVPTDVKYVENLAVALAQSTSTAIFNISGAVAILHIQGKVSTQIQNQANSTYLEHTFLGNICGAVDIDNDSSSVRYHISGVTTDALIKSGTDYPKFATTIKVLEEGSIKLNCAASSTGNIDWKVVYRPLSSGATITAA
jgi:hypothetical protein